MSYGLVTKSPTTDSAAHLTDASSLLGRLDPVDRARVEAESHLLHFRNGDYLIAQGEPSDGIFIVQSGTVKSVYRSDAGRELTLAFWSQGDFVGAPFVLGQQANVWGAQAVGPAAALNVTEGALRSLIAEVPAFAIGLVEILGYKGECYSKLAQVIATHNIESRVAAALLTLADAIGIREAEGLVIGKVRQQDLANLVGATRQSVSLSLRHLQSAGLIRLDATKIVICNRLKLDALVSRGE